MIASPNFAEDGTLFAGTLDYGILHSLDRGSSWQARHYGLLDMASLRDRRFLHSSPRTRQSSQVRRPASSSAPMGGLAWREAAVPAEDDAVLSIAFTPNYQLGGLIAAGTEAGMLLKSHDGGHTWQYMATPCAGRSINALTFLPQQESDPLMLLGAADRIHVSASGGTSWQTWDAGQTVLTLAAYADGVQPPFVLAGLKENGIWRGQAESGERPRRAPEESRNVRKGAA